MMPSSSTLQHDLAHRFKLHAKGGVDRYPAKAHARRVAEKLQQDDGLIVLSATSNVNLPNSDMPAPFRQDRYFYYLSGCNEPDCHVVYDIKNDKLTLWLPPVDTDWRHVVYYGNGSTTQEAMEKYDVDDVHYIQKLDENTNTENIGLSEWQISRTRSIWPMLRALKICGYHDSGPISADRYSEPLFFLNSWLALSGPSTGEQYDQVSAVFDSSVLQAAIDACRVIKDEHEIERIRRANEITAAAHTSVLKGMPSFQNEAEVEAAYMQVCIVRRAKEQAYDPIAGSGPNAAVLHYSENLANFDQGQTVVLDAGCEVERYASDVTRTIPINKRRPGHWPSKEAEDIYKLVEKIQESCIKQMLPGNKYINTTWHAHEMVIDGLLKLGILKGDPLEIFHAGTSTAFLPHGLGHHVGLEVHDVSPVPHPPIQSQNVDGASIERLRQAFVQWKPEAAGYVQDLNRPENFAIVPGCHASVDSVDAPILESGMVVTIEPGIYFNRFLLERFLGNPRQSRFFDKEVLKRYIPVGGVRIEDDILVTKDGYENLTTAPKGEEMLKVIREAANPCL